jgi:phytoene synthase
VKTAPHDNAGDADRLAFRASAGVCRREAGDVVFASAFLPRAKRDAVHAVYAFFRLVRQAVESAGEEAGAARLRHVPLSALTTGTFDETGHGSCCSGDPFQQRLSLLRERVEDLYAGRLELPTPSARSEEQHVLHAFAVASARYQVPRQDVLDFAEGCRGGLTVRRYATWRSLEAHCRLAGGAAARAALCVLGVTHSGAAEYAAKAGVAVRLTRMLCGLKADAAAGRVCLPLEDLAAFRYTERELAAGVVNESLRRLLCFEVDRARRLYREAAEGLPWVANDGARLAGAILLAWHWRLLDVIERHDYDALSRVPALTRGHKLRALPIAWRLARRRPDAARGQVPTPPGAAPTATAP